MRKQSSPNDRTETTKSEASEDVTERRARSGRRDAPVACSGITLPINSQGPIKSNQWESLTGATGIDWFELAACIEWDQNEASGWFEQFHQAKEKAQEVFKAQTVQIGSHLVGVARSGAGRGADSHKEIQLTWQNVKVGLSQRDNATRQLSNATLQVTGVPCLIVGWGTSWEFFHELIRLMGGQIKDEWVRRVDLCVDVPGLNFATDVYPLLQNRQICSRCRGRSYHENGQRATGFSIGKSKRIRVQIYDKIADCLANHDGVYVQAMIQHRWKLSPKSATRIEWQIGRPSLMEYGLDTAREVMSRFPDLYAKLTAETGGAFRITNEAPDRKNNHQSRTSTHPLWKRIVEIGLETVGAGNEPLERVDRSNLDELRAVKQIIGFATSIANRRQSICETTDDVLRLIVESIKANGVTDNDIFEAFSKKAKASGTWEAIFSFPGKEAA